ncbi:hypothetical protein CCOS865_00922 [Pseudomonas reidholzensis]|uniref:Uncharacterized protein n=1 Tax=Pseudomonas reidholzensis TaxID=1785162 RepID=A0A383RPJ8_9PSED|nr:hypothetical protein CCOS865_00922 [Pseudomonas reidholzensis]
MPIRILSNILASALRRSAPTVSSHCFYPIHTQSHRKSVQKKVSP